MLGLENIVRDFASGMTRADALSPRWVSRSGRAYQPGIGPHAEVRAVDLVVREMHDQDPVSYAVAGPRDYPGSRLKCDLVMGDPPEWAIEIKMARAFGDNGKLDDTWLKDLLSPYAEDHSALSDAEKLRTSGFACRMAVLVYGFDYSSRPLDRALDALDVLLCHQGPIGERIAAPLTDLVHPVHAQGLVVAWEVLRP